MKSKESKRRRIAIEIAAALVGIFLASKLGPAVQDYFAPKFKIICPICNFGPNEPRSRP